VTFGRNARYIYSLPRGCLAFSLATNPTLDVIIAAAESRDSKAAEKAASDREGTQDFLLGMLV